MPAEPLPLDTTVVETLAGISTATLTTVLLKKGLRNVWMRGTRPIRPGQPRLVGRAFTLRFVPAREDLATPASWASPISTRAAIEAMPEGCDRRGRCDGRHRCRHLRRHPLRAHGQARRGGAGHRRRGARRRRACSAPACRSGADGRRGAALGRRPDLRRLAGARSPAAASRSSPTTSSSSMTTARC